MAGIRRVLALRAFALAAAAGCTSAGVASLQRGPEAIITPDGLIRVDHPLRAVLYVKPDHGIGDHSRYTIGDVVVTFDPDSLRPSPEQIERMQQHLRDTASQGMIEDGATLVDAAGPCVIAVRLGIVDLTLLDHNSRAEARTHVVASSGVMTLALEMRDSQSGEPLLRVGQRRSIEGGLHYGDDLPDWTHVRHTLDRMLLELLRTLDESVPPSTASARAQACAETG